jgi:hypothetical protein
MMMVCLKEPVSIPSKFGSTSLPPEVQQQAATTPENFGSTSLPLEVQHKAATTPVWQRKRIQDQVTFIRPPFS